MLVAALHKSFLPRLRLYSSCAACCFTASGIPPLQTQSLYSHRPRDGVSVGGPEEKIILRLISGMCRLEFMLHFPLVTQIVHVLCSAQAPTSYAAKQHTPSLGHGAADRGELLQLPRLPPGS